MTSTSAVHSLVPKLPVSPSRSPSWHAAKVIPAIDDCKVVTTKKRLPIFDYLYDTRAERDAGSTLANALRGPKNGVHLTRSTPDGSRSNDTLLAIARREQGVVTRPLSEAETYLVTSMTAHAVIEAVTARPRHLTLQEIEDALVEMYASFLGARP